MGTYITFPDLLIWLPLLAGILCFFTKEERHSRNTALIFSLLILAVSIATLVFNDEKKYFNYNNVNYYWLKYMGANYFIGLDGMGKMLVLLTSISFPLIFVATAKAPVKKAPAKKAPAKKAPAKKAPAKKVVKKAVKKK